MDWDNMDEEEQMAFFLLLDDDDRKRKRKNGGIEPGSRILFSLLFIAFVLDIIYSNVFLTVALYVFAAVVLAAIITYKIRSRKILNQKLRPTKLDKYLFRFADALSMARFRFNQKYPPNWRTGR